MFQRILQVLEKFVMDLGNCCLFETAVISDLLKANV